MKTQMAISLLLIINTSAFADNSTALQSGDAIQKVDGKSASDPQTTLQNLDGSKAKLQITRNGESKEIIYTTENTKHRVKKSCYIKPCQFSGDFDGDGKLDTAILVEDQDSKRGILFQFANGKIVLVGAGDEDFNWMNRWSMMKKGTTLLGDSYPSAALGDAIFAEHIESANALLYWNGSKFVWDERAD